MVVCVCVCVCVCDVCVMCDVCLWEISVREWKLYAGNIAPTDRHSSRFWYTLVTFGM